MSNTNVTFASRHIVIVSALCMLLLSILLSSCDTSFSPSADTQNHTSTLTMQTTPGSSDSSTQSITYSTNSHDVLIRTFYGGGLSGSLELSPDISIYGDGTFILGTEQQGSINSDTLQQLLHTLVGTYGLLSFTRQQFVDVQDQNSAYLEVTLDGKQHEFVYGSFGNEQESTQEMDQYQKLGKAITAIKEALKGSLRPYKGTAFALLARQIFNPDRAQTVDWPLTAFTVAQVAAAECGLSPPDETSPNKETGCLKYLIPHSAVLLTPAQFQALKGGLNGQMQGLVTEAGLYYSITLRPLLPDELPQKTLAMFGSNQFSYNGVPLITGNVPPVPTPTPSA